jgi:hypothetical protein
VDNLKLKTSRRPNPASYHFRLPALPPSVQKMSLQTAGDIPLKISSENSGPNSERRITPSWTIGQLKSKLEPVTGIPPLSQKLTLKLGGRQSIPIEAVDEENTQIGSFPLAPYAELHVSSEFIDHRFAKHVVILSPLYVREAVFSSDVLPS